VYFTSKQGGAAAAGYIFEYLPRSERIRLIYESPGHTVFSGPDNLVVSPRGNLVVCEDRVTRNVKAQSIAGVSHDGVLHKFCQINPEIRAVWNGIDMGKQALNSEWAGVCFSADGVWMFANIFNPGVTVAITGPWDAGWM
jgi:secreted PhoX family phosphatase